MTDEIPEGYVGNLTPEHQRKLQQFWTRISEITGTKHAKDNSAGSVRSASNSHHEPNDKYGQSDAFKHYLSTESPESVRKSLWSCVRNDNPDSTALRFLRARKWEVEKAIVMFITMVEWRGLQNVDAVIVKGGEGVGLKEKRNQDEDGFMLQFRTGKSFVRGLDKNRRPVYIVRPRLHNPKAQTTKAMEMYILHGIESIRMLVKDPFDTACLIFDLTGFGLRNMDFAAVKFLVQVFEARYPETLGVVLIHNAPWVFQGIWKIVRGWLDPVVADKVHFTNNGADLEEFIPKENLMTEYGGADDYTYQYIEPKQGENDPMQDLDKVKKLTEEREAIIAEYEKTTIEWAELDAATAAAKEKYSARSQLAEKLAENYWQLDPHIRARNIYDRLGILSETGEVNFAPKT